MELRTTDRTRPWQRRHAPGRHVRARPARWDSERRRALRHRQWVVFGAGLVVVASGLVSPLAAATSGERERRIVFQRQDVVGGFKVMLSNSSGSWTRRLTSLRSSAAVPRWGPWGYRIMYTRASMEGSAATDLMVMGARGRHKKVLLPGGGRNFIEDLAWAPGADRVVLVMTRGEDTDLWIYTLATRKLDRLRAGHHPDRVPLTVDWSRNGTIVFSAIDFSDGAQEDTDLFVVRPDGSGLRQLTNTPTRAEESPRFPPDGRQLLYAILSGRCRYLVVARPDGTRPRRAAKGCDTWAGSWSPNSRRLLVQTISAKPMEEIWATSVDGLSQRFITEGTHASWRPR